MRYVFFGTPKFAVIILEKLIKAGFSPAAVVCNPDRPVGRKKEITPPPVKARIMNYESGIRDKIKILQPEKLDDDFRNSLFLIHDSFEFFVVAAFAKIIPKEILEVPRLGAVGLHPSLLPKYRGPTPIQSVVLAGEEKTGITLFLVDEEVDHGPIFAQRALENYESGIMNYEKLHDALANLGAELLVETLPKFVKGEIKPTPQNHDEATFTKKFRTEDAFVTPEDLENAEKEGGEPAVKIERMVRALNPEPGIWTKKDNKRMKILEAKLTNDGKLKLLCIQFEGKKPILLS